jgi:hypothetical protein
VTKKILLATAATLLLALATVGLGATGGSAAPARPDGVATHRAMTSRRDVAGAEAEHRRNDVPDSEAAGADAAAGASSGAVPRTGADAAPYVLIGVTLIVAGLFAITTSIRRRTPA